jgi:hypothetical protein
MSTRLLIPQNFSEGGNISWIYMAFFPLKSLAKHVFTRKNLTLVLHLVLALSKHAKYFFLSSFFCFRVSKLFNSSQRSVFFLITCNEAAEADLCTLNPIYQSAFIKHLSSKEGRKYERIHISHKN